MPSPRTSGARVVVGLLALGVALAAFAIAFQWRQTSRCLGFYGGQVARTITTAPHVEVWHLAAGSRAGTVVVVGRCDVSRAAGLVHLRRGLVEDANFDWRPGQPGRLPVGAWEVALAFAAGPDMPPEAVVAASGPTAGSLCVVGRPGRVSLGRLDRGLRTWLETACPRPEGSPQCRQ